MARITVELSEDAKVKFNAIAILQGKNMAVILREFIDKQVKKNENLISN